MRPFQMTLVHMGNAHKEGSSHTSKHNEHSKKTIKEAQGITLKHERKKAPRIKYKWHQKYIKFIKKGAIASWI